MPPDEIIVEVVSIEATSFVIDVVAAPVLPVVVEVIAAPGTVVVVDVAEVGLRGPKGDQGTAGTAGAAGAAGAPGADGAEGPQGPAGASGTGFLIGSGPPTSQGVPGDIYLDKANGAFYGPRTAGEPSFFETLYGGAASFEFYDNTVPAYELGVRFTPSADCVVYGIRFYHHPSSGGTSHIVSLWANAGGTLLARETHNDTGNGWNEHLFADPVPVTAAQSYTASWRVPLVDLGYPREQTFLPQTVDGIAYTDGSYTETVGAYPNDGTTTTGYGVEPLVGATLAVWPLAVDLVTEAEN